MIKSFIFLISFLSLLFSFEVNRSFLSSSSYVPFSFLHSSDTDIILPPPQSKEGPNKALILIPGGKVPNENYTMVAESMQKFATFKLWIGIPHCLANLCDPIDPTTFGLNAAIFRVISVLNNSLDGSLTSQDIFIFGHSLGGTGARHFVDLNPGFAGLGLLGTQYIGDHEDFKGTLGYPKDLAAFPIPFLALTGELDAIPFTHAGSLFSQREGFDETQQAQKIIVVIPGMDHSDFCQGFHVSGDVVSELSAEEAVSQIGEVIGSWLDLQILEEVSLETKATIEKYEDKTRILMNSFYEASFNDQTKWCETAQKLLSGLEESEWDSLQVIGVFIDGSNFDLEHSHPNYTLTDSSNLILYVPSYPYYEEIKDFSYSTLYSGARDIACKMISADRIGNVMKFDVPELSQQKTCKDVNEKAFDLAKQIVLKNYPNSFLRFENQGVPPKFIDDSFTLIGPQWVFLSSLKVDSKTGEIGSPDMYSSLDSITYPGVRYCKVLSPARAVEYIMSTGLTKRYQ